MQSRTHTCNELRLENEEEVVTLVGWYENLRKVSKNLGFLVLRDFYGTTQIVIESEEMMEQLGGINSESTLLFEGVHHLNKGDVLNPRLYSEQIRHYKNFFRPPIYFDVGSFGCGSTKKRKGKRKNA